MEHPIALLVVDDEPELLDSLSVPLGRRGFQIVSAGTASEAVELVRLQRFEVVLLDLALPDIPGDQVLQVLRRLDPELEVVILTGHGSLHSAVECTRRGAFDYIAKPPEVERLVEILRAAARHRRERLASGPAVPAEDEALHLF